MKLRNAGWLFSAISLTGLVLVGCGTASSNGSVSAQIGGSNSVTVNENGQSTVIQGGLPYNGPQNLKKYEAAAAANPTNVQAQIQAGVAAHVNQDDAKAIIYYKKAIQLDPKNAVPYTNIGNIYLRDKGDAKAALPYYQKATQVNPAYGYGWWNLAITEAKLGNKTVAQQAVATGLKKVPKTDPAYVGLQDEQKALQ